MLLPKQKTLVKFIKVFIPIFILFVLAFESKEIFKDFNWQLLNHYLDRLALNKLLFILILGLISLIPMFFYDVILLQIFHIYIPKRKLIFFSLAANAYSNLIGFGGVAGTTLRSFYYRSYVRNDTPYIQTIAKLSLFYLSGLSVLSWITAFSDMHVYSEVKFIKLAVWAIALYTPILLIVFFLKKSFWNLGHVKRGFISELMAVSLFEWLFVVFCIWGIANFLGVSVPFTNVFPIVIISACAGIISLIPGGIGSFDLVFLIGMETKGVPAELSLLIIMFYRLSYYIVPAVLGTPFIMRHFMLKKNTR
ncbi:lysylphosphatidylglycerol synthase domain-containing protein [Cytobacillus massiliigabonensis]|uniref:lysylphosphatidylglycerol synthase domain-containing protein n=1 Tax=Cytobacillus massiliigabonensis TaxID=1871011 RepID=UPI000C84D259|nr:lysylphosphatidylglycerol synthase domain-containing protein [Cytobacillus massiliigabonensis]